jgi:hypothetical protein
MAALMAVVSAAWEALASAVTKRPPWRQVVFAADCDEDGNCPLCGIDYADCSCPGPTMDEYDYKEKGGQLFARPKIFSARQPSRRKT